MSLFYSTNLLKKALCQILAPVALGFALFAMPAQGQVSILFPGDPGNPFPTGLAEIFSKPALADMDNDGDLDVMSGSANGTIVYLENQAGNFVQMVDADNPFSSVALGEGSKANIAVADLDGDGDYDMLAGLQSGIFWYFENTGDPDAAAFGAGVMNPFSIGDIGNNASPYLVDLNNDGLVDLVTGEFSGVVSYFKNTGTTSVPKFTEQLGGSNPFNSIFVAQTSQPAVGDLDGDGDLDLLLGSSDGTLLYYENMGGTYVQLTGDANPIDGFTVPVDMTSGKGESGPAIGDIDGDTNNDIVVGDIQGDYTLIDTNGPLPVELTSFSAVRNQDEVVLAWTTASELNNAGFEVQQRTSNGFETVGWVAGAGTTNEAHSYSFTISNVQPGRHAFRLKQIDFDGVFAYSASTEVAIALSKNFFMTDVYPNPFNPQATFNLTVARDQQVTVAVYDMQGRMISLLHSGELQAEQPYRFSIDGSDWASGKYLIRAVGEAFETTRMVTLLK